MERLDTFIENNSDESLTHNEVTKVLENIIKIIDEEKLRPLLRAVYVERLANHSKEVAEIIATETQERCWNCDRNAYHKNDWHCSQGKTKNV